MMVCGCDDGGCGHLLACADSVGGRGGGRAGIFQGKASSVQKLKEAARTISEAKVIAK